MIFLRFPHELWSLELLLPNTPQAPPRQGISIIEAIDQTGHVAGRPPMSILFGEGSLTRAELTLFIDLAQMMHEVEEGPNVPYELKHWRHFWGKNAFKNWDTTSGNTDDLPLRPVTLQENRVRVGKLKVNHPPIIDFPGPPGPARLHGCPVYMSVSPVAQDQLLQPIWKDENGKFVSPRCVETDMPVGNCIDLAVLRFDRTATSRIKEYNIARITNAARRRLMHFAAVGAEVAAYIPADCQAPILQLPELVGDRVEETTNAKQAMLDFGARRRLGRRRPSAIVNLEIAWGADRLWRFDLHAFHDNTYIAEGQYISACINETCFSVHDVMDRISELEQEEEEEEEWLRRFDNRRQARILAQELGFIDNSDSCDSE
ncbi:hypothetical protein H9Q70_013149 [Fusarium xylarioides]|nr:hypothetical protein H9Q70_013149 [Fusarium xylarioides]